MFVWNLYKATFIGARKIGQMTKISYCGENANEVGAPLARSPKAAGR